jgi:hypothetical protein
MDITSFLRAKLANKLTLTFQVPSGVESNERSEAAFLKKLGL